MDPKEVHAAAWEFFRNQIEYPTEPSGDVFRLYQEFISRYALNQPVTTLTSDLYVISDDAKTIAKIPEETSVSEFLSNVNRPAGSTVQITRGDQIQQNVDHLAKDDGVTVTMADDSTLVYTILELLKPADFSRLHELLTRAEDISQSDCTAESWTALNKVVTEANVVYINPEATQEEIDEACQWMEEAFTKLVYLKADYSRLHSLKERADSLDVDSYKDFSAVMAAVQAIEEDLPKSRQADVDRIADNQEAALNALQEKDADYFRVSEQKERANSLNADDYKDFTGVTATLNAIIEGLPKSRQSDVDKKANDLKKAIDALQEKEADYAKVNEQKERAAVLKAEDYKDFFAVNAALAAVIKGLPKSRQSEVDQMANDLKEAIDGLQEKEADYSRVNALKERANSLKANDYKDFSAVTAALNAIVEGLPKSKQAEVDRIASSLEAALNSLEEKLDLTILELVYIHSIRIDLKEFQNTGKAEFEQARKSAGIVLNSAESQQEVSQAAASLNRALLALRRIPNSMNLDSLH